MTTADTKTCGFCKAENPSDAVRCVRCGKRLSGSNLDIVQWVLLLGSIAAILWGFAELSEITAGVGLFAVAGVLAIFARIAQAGRHQRENQERHERLIGRLNRLGEKE